MGASNAIGFYLQLEDQLSPVLKDAGKAYDRFTKYIDQANTRAFKSAKKGFGAIADLVEQFEQIPAMAAKSYTKTIASVGRKTLRVPIDIAVSGKAKKALTSAMVDAVSMAFSKAKLRLTPTRPSKRSSLFDTSVGLRQAYKHMTQPPDLSGSLNIPRFAKGGIVGGPSGIDKVKAYLTKGEMVLPTESAKQLQAIAGAAQSASGKFMAFPQALSEAHANILMLMKILPKLQAAEKLGLDPAAAQKLGIAEKALAIEQKNLMDATVGLHTNYKGKLAPALHDVTEQVRALRDGVQKADGPVTKFLKSITNDVKYLAVRQALVGITEALSHGMGATGLDKAADGLVTNFRQINKTLHLSEDGLTDLRAAFVANSSTLPASIRDYSELSETLQSLINSGATKELALSLTNGVQTFSAATGVAREEATKLAITLTKTLHMGASDAADQMANLSQIASTAGISADVLTAATLRAADAGQAFLTKLSPEKAGKALDTMSKIIAAAEQGGGAGTGDAIGDILGGALADPDKLKTLGGILHKTQDQLKDILTSGDVSGFFDAINTGGPMVAKQMASAFGIDEKVLLNLSNNTASMNDVLDKLGTTSIKAGDGVKVLSKQAEGNMTTVQKWKSAIQNAIASFGPMPDIIAGFKDLDPVAMWDFAKGLGEAAKGFRIIAIPLRFLGSGVIKLITAGFALLAPVVMTLTGALWAMVAPLLANPITWIVIAVIAAIAAIIYFRKEIATFMVWLWDEFVGGMKAAGEAISAGWDWLVDQLSDFVGWLKEPASAAVDVFLAPWYLVSSFFDDLWSGILDKFNHYIGKITGAWESVKGMFSWFGDDAPASTAGVPKMSRGGIIQGGSGRGIDDVLTMLGKGEMVLPATAADQLKLMASQVQNMSPGVPPRADLDRLSSAPGLGNDDGIKGLLTDMLAVMRDQLSVMKTDGPSASLPVASAPRGSTNKSIARGVH